MALLLTPISSPADVWLRAFNQLMPELEVRVWPNVGNPAEIEFAAITQLPDGELGKFPNLRLILSLVAGMDLLLSDPALPVNVPIVRVGDSDDEGLMTDFIATNVLRHHCDLPYYQNNQSHAEWSRKPRRVVTDRRVGVMGLGSIGLKAARRLADYGFNVAGWVRTPRQVEKIEIFSGLGQLKPFLNRSEIVVNVLPLTMETQNILNLDTLAMLPKGASLINVGRGATIVDDDLIAALDSEHLEAATLDVFRVEPLPSDHPFWRHPGITVTPHVARNLNPKGIAAKTIAYIKKVKQGAEIDRRVDRLVGY
jgi:glyoxylate/hydroxypyruvate reductase A